MQQTDCSAKSEFTSKAKPIHISCNQHRYCTQHQGWVLKSDGEGLTIKSAGGLRQRWICNCCNTKNHQKLASLFGVDADDILED